MLICTSKQAAATRRTVEYLGAEMGRRDYFVSTAEERQPQAFLVEQPPRHTIRNHFHATDQFQVFVHGKGRLGNKSVEAVALQYADAFTAYGPIVSAEDPIFYMTLRAVSDGPQIGRAHV